MTIYHIMLSKIIPWLKQFPTALRREPYATGTPDLSHKDANMCISIAPDGKQERLILGATWQGTDPTFRTASITIIESVPTIFDIKGSTPEEIQDGVKQLADIRSR
jgi:hypothetical protein